MTDVLLKHVKVISPTHSRKVCTFNIETDTGEILRIRLDPDLEAFRTRDRERDALLDLIVAVQNQYVDLVVTPIDWTVKNFSGKSLILKEINLT